MPGRIALSGGDEPFIDQLDRFFGFGANVAPRVGYEPLPNEMRLGHDLHRFEGLCNEPDMEVPMRIAMQVDMIACTWSVRG